MIQSLFPNNYHNVRLFPFAYFRESFVMEYCGEVCTPEEFELRRKTYEQNKRRHYYFMSLKTNEVRE